MDRHPKVDSEVSGPHAVEKNEHRTLIKNISIFNGTSEDLIKGKDVVLLDNEIEKIIPAGSKEDVYGKVIDGKGGYLSPGIIDNHLHLMMGVSQPEFFNGPFQYVTCMAVREMEDMLMRGVTTVRDVGGNVFGLRKAVNNGLLPGPRIYGSGGMIAQYSGHVDFRNPNDMPKEWGGPALSTVERPELGCGLLATGVDQVMAAARHYLYLGADFVKIATGGGVTSFTDALYVNELFPEEIEAAVRVAEDYGTYVATHVFNAVGIKRSLNAGVKTIEHGHLIDEEGMELLAEKEAILSTQVYVLTMLEPIFTDANRAGKLKEALNGMDNMFKLAKKYKVKIVYGTDLLFDYEGRKDQLKDLTHSENRGSPLRRS